MNNTYLYSYLSKIQSLCNNNGCKNCPLFVAPNGKVGCPLQTTPDKWNIDIYFKISERKASDKMEDIYDT